MESIGKQVCEELRKGGIEASWEHPGYVSILVCYDWTWAIGTANGVWGGNMVGPNGESGDCFESGILGVSQDVQGIAKMIAEQVDKVSGPELEKARLLEALRSKEVA